MSVVAARVYDDRIEVAADSICVRGWSKMNSAEKKHTKLFRFKDLVVGGVGKSEEISLFQRYMKSHMIKEMNEDGILDFLIEFKRWKKDFCGDDEIENRYILASKGQCYSTNGFFVFRVNDYYAIGAGDDFARGAMYMGATPEQAVKVACDLCVYVSEPIVKEIVPINEDSGQGADVGEDNE